MKLKLLFAAALFSANLYGAEDFNSELSHFSGGAVLAGGVSAIVDHYYPEYRADRRTIGFGVSTLAALVDQSIQYAEHGNARGQLLDTAAHIAGSALGAYITDEFLLSPVIQNSPSEGDYVGVSLQRSF